ncbi:uncharacterized protein LOC113305959 [Papaver somniferum]|uniref:uncharacterized protein LOC113305959 n=1 Tax=Papaver somniferum TaxID=3469 RepID=UPI000E70188C|nr:uncharacterized protein LOC113305959 [Papaver somniferum]
MVDDQQKFIHSDFDLQSLELFSLHNKEGTMELHVLPGGVKEIRCDLLKFHAASGYEFKIYRNDKLRIGVVGSLFIIKELDNQHTCVGEFVNIPQVSKKLISSLIIDEIKQDPNKKTNHIMDQFTREYGFDISRYYAYPGKKHAFNTTWGENEKSFMFLNRYKNKLIETNPGSHVVLEVEEGTQKFQRMFIFFEACSRGFNFCRPVLFVDAAHLKSKYLAHMMEATGLTGNAVSSENEANWKWFLENSKEVLSHLRPNLTFVSDRGIGLVTQIPVVFHGDVHGWCYWHMEYNINTFLPKNCKVYKKYVLGLFKKYAYASTHKEFTENWDKLRKVENQKLQDYISITPVDKWASFFFKGRRYDYEALLHENKMHGCNYRVTKSSEYVFEVHASLTQTIDLKRKTCSCNRWRINGFPCYHGEWRRSLQGTFVLEVNVLQCFHSVICQRINKFD